MSVREKPVEVITRGERRRVWMPEQKRDIVMESLERGGSPIAVAGRHGIGTGLLYTWRRQMVEGQLQALLPAALNFVAITALPDGGGTGAAPAVPQAAPSAPIPGAAPAAIEIVLPDGVTVRVGAAVDEAAAWSIIVACRSTSTHCPMTLPSCSRCFGMPCTNTARCMPRTTSCGC